MDYHVKKVFVNITKYVIFVYYRMFCFERWPYVSGRIWARPGPVRFVFKCGLRVVVDAEFILIEGHSGTNDPMPFKMWYQMSLIQ